MQHHPVVLFDGVCNLCNRSVQFIIKRDREKHFRFAALQGKTGAEVLQKFNLPVTVFHSFILLEGDKVYTRSAAALRVARQLKGWRWLYVLIIIPPFIRNAAYNIIAKNRYRWFGKRDACMVPTAALRSLFLD